MTADNCCGRRSTSGNGKSLLQIDNSISSNRDSTAGWRFVQWGVPGLILALLPKCPMCIAAYLAAATGISLSVTSTETLRTFVMYGCYAVFLHLSAQLIWSVVRRFGAQLGEGQAAVG